MRMLVFFRNIFVLLMIMFFVSINDVNASILSIDDVSNGVNQSNTFQELTSLELYVESKVDSVNKTLDIYSEDVKLFSFTYGDDYIEYNNRDVVVTEENCTDDLFTFVWIGSLIESLVHLSGYENKTISEDFLLVNDYEKYGLQVESESYNFSGSDENSSWNISGVYMKYFKVSLDTEKIDALMLEYGEDIENEEEDNNVISSLIPNIEVRDITENSVTIYPKVDNFITDDPDFVLGCYVYRADSEFGDYERISDIAVNCLDSVGIVDKGLESGKIYYYKAIVDGGENYSDVLSVTTKVNSVTDGNIETGNNSDSNNNNADKDVLENPKTGIFDLFVIVGVMLVSSFVAMFCLKNKAFED